MGDLIRLNLSPKISFTIKKTNSWYLYLRFVADTYSFQMSVIAAGITSWLEGRQFSLEWKAPKKKRIQMRGVRMALEKVFLIVELHGEDLSR